MWLLVPAMFYTANNILIFLAIGKTDMSQFGVINIQGLHYNQSLGTLNVVDNTLSTVFIFDAGCYAAQPYGSGCPGTGGYVPSLGMTGCPQVGQQVTLTDDHLSHLTKEGVDKGRLSLHFAGQHPDVGLVHSFLPSPATPALAIIKPRWTHEIALVGRYVNRGESTSPMPQTTCFNGVTPHEEDL